jgi:hypothetical protein
VPSTSPNGRRKSRNVQAWSRPIVRREDRGGRSGMQSNCGLGRSHNGKPPRLSKADVSRFRPPQSPRRNPPRGHGQTGGEADTIDRVRGSRSNVVPIPNEGPNNVVRVQWRKAERKASRSVGSPTSDRAVWGSSPDQPVWRGVISTRQKWPLVPTVFGPISKQNATWAGSLAHEAKFHFLARPEQ